MSIFDSTLEFEILLYDIVEGFVEKGKSLEWIQDYVSDCISYAIEDYKSDIINEWVI